MTAREHTGQQVGRFGGSVDDLTDARCDADLARIALLEGVRMNRLSATLATTDHASPATRHQPRWATTEHVVYAYHHGASPAITYHSVAHACAGRANTLDEARTSYRSDMAELRGAGQRELSSAVEHLEAIVAEMWVRDRIGAMRRDSMGERMFLQTLLSEGPAQCALRAHMERAASRGMRAVVVIVEPDDTVGSVLDQMRADDVLFVAHRDADTIVGWSALFGPEAGEADEAIRVPDNAGLRAMPVRELTRNHRAIRIVVGQR
jgi:hypothetical protein